MAMIERLSAMEVLDSRGRPTVEATCVLEGGASASVSIPSGASTGMAEALELRDGDPRRYRGLGCQRAVANIEGVIERELKQRHVSGQEELDRRLIALDGTENKSRLGANALLAVSLAYARAEARLLNRPLWQHFGHLAGVVPKTLPRMTINLFSGGKHAGGQVAIQDVLVVPTGAATIDQGLAMVYAVYQSAAEICQKKYNTRPLSADEGGLAPPFPDVPTMLGDAVEAIRSAGYAPGKDVAIAIDVASSHFYRDGAYHLDGKALDSRQMIETVEHWVKRFSIVSVEDALAEQDWANWPALRQTLAGKALTLGDDFLCTNPKRIARAIGSRAADALLLKVNQIGTLTEAIEALKLARGAGWRVTVSARSGETEDNWLADLSVGLGGDQIKVGSIRQSERLAKYNRLLRIERETGFPVVGWPG